MDTLARDLRYAVQNAAEDARRRHRGHPDARARHRRDDDDVQRRLREAAPAGAICRFRSTGHPVQHQRHADPTAWCGSAGRCPTSTALRSSATSFETVASFTGALLSMSGHGDPEHIEGEVVSSDYFQTLRVTPSAGRAFTSSEEDTVAGAQPVTMISWRTVEAKVRRRSRR